MNRIVFDTETTGLGTTDRLVSIAWRKFDRSYNTIEKKHYIVKPLDFVITNSYFHGITQEHALVVGEPVGVILDHFKNALLDCDTIIAHNISFDMRFVMNEYRKIHHTDFVFPNAVDTCPMGKKYMKMAGRKRPSLGMLYSYLFEREMDGSHTADGDVDACFECYREMKDITRFFVQN